ncbi:MAG: discoidin domain-containing protein, partial [Alphaproteobacteria bacterium]|nr:discoidin domain-containing protein [Alphaproteobacteria bacterium]
EIEEELPIATHENFGLVKIGSGFTNDAGTISAPIITKATEDNFGIMKTGDGLVNNNGTISRDELNPATFSNFGIVKLGDNLSINQSGEMEICDMANAATIYNLGNVKICNNGIVDLEEQTLVYRLFVTEDLVIQFQTDFEVQDDFSFVLEIVSDGTHIISFNENLNPKISPLPINRGITKLTFSKKLGVPSYNVEISRLDAPEPTLLTPAIETCISSEFSVTSPNGGSWLPNSLLKTSYNGYCDITELNFKFETLVCVDYVNYLSRSNSVSMGEFVLKGSNDEKNWTTLIYKNGEIIYGKVYTEIKGCFRYYNLKIGYTSDDNKPGAVTLWGTQIDNNESEIIPITPYMSSNETTFAKMTANNIESGSAADITDFNCNSLLKMTKTGDDWIKYELSEAKIANILELNFRGMGEYYGFYGDRHPNWFKLEGSNDDETWTLLLERQYAENELSWNNNVVFYNFENSNAYKYYKFTCVATNSANAQWGISGFKLYQRKIGKYHFYRGVPKLISANQDGYEITASSQYDNNYVGYFAFDDDAGTNWVTAENPGDAWLQIKLPTATAFEAVQIASREDKNLDQSPTAFQIQGSNDGENWDTLDSESDISWAALGELKLFEFANETAYLYYRLYITACQGSSYKGCGRFILGNAVREYKRWLNQYNCIVPIINSNSQDGYLVTAKSNWGSHYPWKAFDRAVSNSDDAWECNDSDKSDSSGNCNTWLQIQLPEAKVANALYLQERSGRSTRDPKDFILQASNNGTTWTTLLAQTDQSYTGKTWLFDNETPYTYYRLSITKSNQANDNVCVGIMNLLYHEIITEY